MIAVRHGNVQARNAVADLAQAHAQLAGRGCAVVAGVLKHTAQNVAFLCVQVVLQVVGQAELLRLGCVWCVWLCVGKRLNWRVQKQIAAVAECDGAVQHVFKFAHVTVKGMYPQLLEYRSLDGWHLQAGFLADPGQKRLAQLRQVVQPLPQWRYINHDHIEPVIQVLAKSLGGHFFAELFMGSTQHAHIHHVFLRRAQRPDDTFLDRPQQLGLHDERQIANLIKKQRAALCRLEITHTVLCGAGVGPFTRTEKFSLKQIFRNSSAIDRDKRTAGTVTALMHGPGHQFFACA